MALVVAELLIAAAVGLVDGGLHRAGHAVCVENHPAINIARRPSNGLDKRGC